MSTTSTGKNAEELASEYLKMSKHKILDMNWRTRFCEIDIVSRSGKCVYFTEVKYRQSDGWGDGFDYITPKKLKQMQFAAEMWIAKNDWDGEVALQAAAVDDHKNVALIEL